MMKAIPWALAAIGAFTPMVREAQYDPYPIRHCDEPLWHWQANVGDCVYSPPGWNCVQSNSSTYFVCNGGQPSARPPLAAQRERPRIIPPDQPGTPPTALESALAAASRDIGAAQRDTKAARHGGTVDIAQAVADLDHARARLIQAEGAVDARH